jgi:hypothetical protein
MLGGFKGLVNDILTLEKTIFSLVYQNLAYDELANTTNYQKISLIDEPIYQVNLTQIQEEKFSKY